LFINRPIRPITHSLQAIQNHLDSPVPIFLANFSNLSVLSVGSLIKRILPIWNIPPQRSYGTWFIRQSNVVRLTTGVHEEKPFGFFGTYSHKFHWSNPKLNRKFTIYINISFCPKFHRSNTQFNWKSTVFIDLRSFILWLLWSSSRCNAKSYKSHILELAREQFSGKIFISLFSLPSLEELFLSGNQFSGYTRDLKWINGFESDWP
jgi:hypothetical protein